MPDNNPVLYILDVGHGNSAVLTDTNGNIIFDAGPGISLYRFLINKNIRKIDVILISHADHDHIGGLLAILACEKFDIGIVRVNTDSVKNTKAWKNITYVLNKCYLEDGIDYNTSLSIRDSGIFNRGVIDIEILAPSLFLTGLGPGSTDRQGRYITTNSISSIIRLTKDGEPIALLPGDIDSVGLEHLIESGTDSTAPVVIFPHHGAKPGKADHVEFARQVCQTINPKIVIFSIGRGVHNTPNQEIVNTVRAEIPEVRILCTQLSEHCTSELTTEAPSHLTDCFARGQEHNSCCAGTIVIHLDDSFTISPSYDAHVAYIAKNIPQALCLKSLSSPTNSL